jgi:ribose transport system permease protein
MTLPIRPLEILERYALLILLIGACVFFSVNSATPAFHDSTNISNVLSNESVLGILAIATVIPLVANQIDLSVGPTAGLASLLCSGMMAKSGLPLSVAALIAIATGILVGMTNGFLVAKVGINSIVTTLGTSSIVGAAVVWYSKGLSIVSGISPNLLHFGTDKWLGIPKPFFALLLVAIICWYLLQHTPVGRYLYAVGSSPRAAELVGLNVPRLIFGSFVASGLIAGACGILLVATQAGGNPQIGATFTLPAVAAAFLGATAFMPGRYNVWGTFTAVFFLAVCVNGLSLWGVESWVSELFNGIALIAAVGITVVTSKRRTRAAPPAGVSGVDEASLEGGGSSNGDGPVPARANVDEVRP